MKNINFLLILFIVSSIVGVGLYFAIKPHTEYFSMMKPLGAAYNKSTGGIYDGLILDNPVANDWQPQSVVRQANSLSAQVPLSGVADEWGTLFPFANTKFSYGCCPNEFRTGQGCACLTHEQKYAMMTRNGNSTYGRLV